MNHKTAEHNSGASETTRFFCTRISSAASAAGELKQHKKEPNMANKENATPDIGKSADFGAMHNPQPSRARTHARAIRPTGILKESLLDLPGARARVREESADFTAWRVKTFGGDFDPVREAVEDAVAEFSDRQAARDRSLWLKIANEIGYETFRDLYLEQVSIMRECKLRNPSAAFQNRLNRYTNHNSHRTASLTSGAAKCRPVCMRTTEKPGNATGSLQENCASESMYEAYDNAKDMTMDEAYAYCRKLECDRERKHRDTDIGQIEASTLSLDQLVESFEDPSKIQIFSDCGKGRRSIRASERAEEISVALSQLSASDRTFAQAVLEGKDWREMGISRQAFWKRLKKVEIFLAP